MHTPKTTQQRHLSREREEDRTVPPGASPTSQVSRHAPRWSARRKRDAWVFLLIFLLGSGTIVALSYGHVQYAGQGSGTPSGASPTSSTTASTSSGTPSPTTRVITQTARFHLYPFPPSNIGLMQPAVDARGDVWVGEMYANRLARLDPHTGIVTSWEAPNGKNGIMTTTIDAQDKVWFVEQGANYIGRFDPVQQSFRIFPLGTAQGHSMGPQALQFDARGFLWFTAAGGGRIGRLDPATGALKTWPVPPPRPGVFPSPYSLTVLPNGQIWFGDITGGAVGHLDATTGHVTLYLLADPQETVFSMTHDARGRIWFSEIVPGKLGMIDTTNGAITEWSVPTISGRPAALYGIVVTPDGDVWFAANGTNALVRYTPGSATFTFFQSPLTSAGLYGLTLAPAGTLWFTASGPSANFVGEILP